VIVPSGLQRKLTRLTQMSWPELRTRVGQEISKRLDLAMYRAGIGATELRLASAISRDAKFFFGEAEARHRANLLKMHLPDEADAIVEEANAICRHEFRLLGHDKISVGREIDWHSNQGKRTDRLKPWYKIDFLDFSAGGDHKIIWELNRHQHLVTLAKAWLLTGQAQYVNEVVAQWYSWQKANPYPLGVNWASSLEVGLRSISWIWARILLAQCPEMPSNFESDLLIALRLNGRHIERYLSTYFSPNTHLLGEATALFFIGSLCPELPAANRWRNLGWQILLQESERQVREDGVYFEQSLYYHVYALDFFLHARILASVNATAIPELFDGVLKRMVDVVQALSATRAIEGFGDDDGGRVFNPRRNHTECMIDPLVLGAVLYGDKYRSASLTEESIWLFGDKAVEAFDKIAARRELASRSFPAGGIYLMNDSEPCLQQLMIDAGPQGTGHSGHGHADALSVRLSLAGQRFLVDCGTYCYVSDGEERNHFRGTGAHNTLRVDNLDQAVPEGPFAWSSIPQVVAETWLNGKTFDFFVGSHDGYHRLPDPVVHRRSVFHVKAGLWFIRDVAVGQGQHLLETFWHFSPQIEIAEEPGAVKATLSLRDKSSEHACLTFLIDRTSDWVAKVAEGVVSPAYGCKRAAPILRVHTNSGLPKECAVLLLPGKQASGIGEFSALSESSQGQVRGYCYHTARASEFLFLAEGNARWTLGNWRSDAKLLYSKLEDGRFTHVIMVSGTFAEWRDKRFVSHSSGAATFEWLKNAGVQSGTSQGALEDLVFDL
jgi:hypothetical protein